MIKLLQFCWLLGCPALLGAQLDTLPADRQYDWSEVGHAISEATEEINVAALLNGSDYDAAIAAGIDALEATGGTLYFPPGEYALTQTVVLPSGVHLRGAGADVTHLRFHLGGSGNAVEAIGSLDTLVALSADAPRGGTFLIAPQHGLQAGDYLQTTMDDADLVTSSWARGFVGQLVGVTAVSADTLFLDRALRLDLPLARSPSIRRVHPITNIGVHCLSLERLDSTAQQTSQLHFENTVHASVTGVASERTNFAHLTLRSSARAKVQHNYFHGAHNYGGGGRAYGVVLDFATSDCLVENNILDSLRHGVLLQAGANGNVIANNYSRAPFWTGTNLPDDAAGDLALHGNYPFANLFEGNQVQNIVIDESHGANGPHNTFYRNRTERYGIVMGLGSLTNAQTFIGNELTGTPGLFFLTGTNHYVAANVIAGKYLPEGSPIPGGRSLFRAERALYFDAPLPDPLFGFVATDPLLHLPARYRYDVPEARATCVPDFYMPEPIEEPMDTTATNTGNLEADTARWQFHPNPATSELWIDAIAAPTPVAFALFRSDGRSVKRWLISGRQVISIAELPAGVYFLRGNGVTRRVVVMR